MPNKKSFFKNYFLLQIYFIVMSLILLLGIIFFSIFLATNYYIVASIIGGSTILINIVLFVSFYFCIPDAFARIELSQEGIRETLFKKEKNFLFWQEIITIKEEFYNPNARGRTFRRDGTEVFDRELMIKSHFESSDATKNKIVFLMTRVRKNLVLNYNQNPSLKEKLENLHFVSDMASLRPYVVKDNIEVKQYRQAVKEEHKKSDLSNFDED